MTIEDLCMREEDYLFKIKKEKNKSYYILVFVIFITLVTSTLILIYIK